MREIFARYAAGESASVSPRTLTRVASTARGAGPGRVGALRLAGQGRGRTQQRALCRSRTMESLPVDQGRDTGRRERFIRPESEWQSVARPELRILDDGAMAGSTPAHGLAPARRGPQRPRRRADTLLGGILRCGQCGGAVVKVNARTYGCAAHKDRGPAVCGGVAASHADVDRVVLEYVREALTAPEVLASIGGSSPPCGRAGARAPDQVDPDRAREQHVQREIERFTDAVAQMGLSTALAERLRKAEAERDALKRARTSAAVAPLPSAIRAQVHALMAGLDAALRTDVARARDALRAMLGDVQLIEENGAVYAECDNAAKRPTAGRRRRVDGSGCGGRI